MRNRVTPLGDIVAVPLRGAWLGNRGILHEETQVVRLHRGPLWIICALQHEDWRLPQWQRGHFTVLFFHDEAVALAAGHRPCALCRRDAYDSYRRGWVEGADAGSEGRMPLAVEMDRRLHAERLLHRTRDKRLHVTSWAAVPDGAFVLVDESPALVLGERVVPWTTEGYRTAINRPRDGDVCALTPPSTMAALRGGYRPQIDAAALTAADVVTSP